MESNHAEIARPLSYEDLAGIFEHTVLGTQLSESDVASGCRLANAYRIAAITVRPCDVDSAIHWMGTPGAVLGTVVDVPYGFSATSVKTYAVRDMLRRGAKEITTVMNTGKLISRQFQYVETELVQMAEACHQAGAILKVQLESEYLDDELKMIACRIARRVSADYLGTALLSDLALLKEHLRDRVKLLGTVTSISEARKFRDAGCERLASGATAAILDTWKAELEAAAQTAQPRPQAPVIS